MRLISTIEQTFARFIHCYTVRTVVYKYIMREKCSKNCWEFLAKSEEKFRNMRNVTFYLHQTGSESSRHCSF